MRQDFVTIVGEFESNLSVVIPVSDSGNESECLRAVSQFARGVVLDQQSLGDVADARSFGIGASADRQQQLVLGVGKPGSFGLGPAPGVEASQPGPEFEQSTVVVI